MYSNALMIRCWWLNIIYMFVSLNNGQVQLMSYLSALTFSLLSNVSMLLYNASTCFSILICPPLLFHGSLPHFPLAVPRSCLQFPKPASCNTFCHSCALLSSTPRLRDEPYIYLKPINIKVPIYSLFNKFNYSQLHWWAISILLQH